MITVKNFTAEDFQLIDGSKKEWKIYFYIYFIVVIPLGFLFGLFGLLKKGHGYWSTTIAMLSSTLVIVVYLAIKDYVIYKKDIHFKLKYSGTIVVESKSIKTNEHCIYTDSSQIKKIHVSSADVFNQIAVGDELFIEMTKFGKRLLILKRDNLVLQNGS